MKKLWKITIVLVVIFASLFLPGVSKAQDTITICPGFSNPYQRVVFDSSGKARIHAIAPSFIEQTLKDDLQSLKKYSSGQSYEEFREKEMAEIYARIKLKVNVEHGISVMHVRNYVEDINGVLCNVDMFWNNDDGCVVYANAVPIQSLHFYDNDELHALEAAGVISWNGSGFTGRHGEIIRYEEGNRCFVGPPPSSLQGP